MQPTYRRWLLPCLFLVVWLSLTTAVYAERAFRPSRDDCLRYIMDPGNIVVAPRSMIEDCARTPALAWIVPAAAAGLLGPVVARAVSDALQATGSIPVPGATSRDVDYLGLTTYPDDNEFRNRLVMDMWRTMREVAEQGGTWAEQRAAAARRIEFFDGVDYVTDDLWGRLISFQNRFGTPDNVPDRMLGVGPDVPGQGVILDGQAALDWLRNHGAPTVTGPDGKQYIPESAIESVDGCGGAAYWGIKVNGVPVIDPTKGVAVIKR
jgi:hypothetical protein